MVVLPILWTVSLAFQQVRLLNLRQAGIIGDYSLDNFTNVLGSPGFVDALVTTLLYSVLGTACAIGLGLIAALALRRPFRGRGLVRAACCCRTSPRWSPRPSSGPRCSTRSSASSTTRAPRCSAGTSRSPSSAPPSRSPSSASTPTSPPRSLTVILFEAWRSFPFAFLFLTARIQAIPETLEEAATVDGATPTQRFRHIILPQLLPTIAVLTVLRFIWTFNNFDDIYLLTGGGAGTQVVAVRVYDYLINRGDIGAAAAQALVLAAILAVLVGTYLKLFGRQEEVA